LPRRLTHQEAANQPCHPLFLLLDSPVVAVVAAVVEQQAPEGLRSQPVAAALQQTRHDTAGKPPAGPPNRYPPESCQRTADIEEAQPAWESEP
jgi:hypothetical protein